jgi:putative oxidoreductase
VEIALRIAVGLILLWAAAAKLRDLRAFATTLPRYGVPPRAVRAAASAVVALELLLGAALLLGVATRAAAIAAAVLMLLFAAVLLRARIAGTARMACRCFGGQGESGTILLAVRALLIGLAAALVATGLPYVGADALLVAVVAVLAVAVALLALLVIALYRQVGVLSQRLAPRTALELAEEGPALGAPPPPLSALAGEGAELVAFMSANCRLCHELAPALRALAREGVAVRAVEEATEPEAFQRWNVPGTPFVAYLVDGVVRSKGLVNTLEQVDWVVETGSERARPLGA